MTRYFCHECSFEDDGFPTNSQGPVCPRCQGAFVEEIPAEESGADDPRDFDPDDGGEEGGGGALPFGLFGGGGPGGGGPAFFQFVAHGPGGTGPFVAAGRGGAEAGGAQAGLNPLTMAMLQAFGMAPPPQGVRAPPLRRVQSEGAAEQPRADQAGEGEGDDRREQVPLRNLAAFLGEAFGGGPRQPHPADNPANNPFAEGGHEAPLNPEGESHGDAQRAGSPNAAGPQQPQPPHPLNHLLSLLNVFGLNTQVLGGGLGGFALRGSAGDYAWGSEADFQQLLNDLMEQASPGFPRAGPLLPFASDAR
ncbi:E3 ubiquitin-protein ligase RNF115/126 [Rhodotorula toruloides]|uniref:E3 ubiquitin-protein ligase RNF115/126 n=1 Tax=Rhodotorula toruloides TaxID=5286 RepID=A0A511KEH7_RHOTO|nr:E3 ubiquitin-protein ligase RNF115/126 [Rhodotorula toruloides]